MAELVDLHVLPLVKAAEQDQVVFPAVFAASPPRRAARGREKDHLLLYLSLQGKLPIAGDKENILMQHLSKAYYETAGSVTYALRVVADTLNQYLLERNHRHASSGQYCNGLFGQLVRREGQIYLAISGAMAAFHIAADSVEKYFDPNMEGVGLGQTRSAPVRFYQFGIQGNDNLILAACPSNSWSPLSLAGLHGQGPESLRRRLFQRSDANVEAILVQARLGEGVIRLYPPPAPLTSSDSPGASPAVRRDADPLIVEKASSAVALREQKEPSSISSPPTERLASPERASAPSQSGLSAIQTPQDDSSAQPGLVLSETKPVTFASPPKKAEAVPGTAKVVSSPIKAGGVQKLFSQSGAVIARLIRKLVRWVLPGEGFFSIPTSAMAFGAIAIPLVVVTIAVVVYLQRGRQAEYQTLFAQAVQAASRAPTQPDWQSQRADWQAALDYLKQAEAHNRNADTDRLRKEIQAAIDEIDLIGRLDYRPAIIGGLPDSMLINRLVSVGSDLFILDQAGGKVYHGRLTASGFEMNKNFSCQMSVPGKINLIVDIAAWPAGNSPDVPLAAIDEDGNLLFCQVGDDPQMIPLPGPKSLGFGKIKRFTLDASDLYLLDPLSDAVWALWNMNFAEPSASFFEDQPHPALQKVVDLAANKSELYLLFEDGHLALCYAGGIGGASVECTDPAPITDLRPGRQGNTLSPANPYTQIVFSPPPDPSLYMLEPLTQSISHFSLRSLGFQRQYLPRNELAGGKATAFAVNTIDRLFFLAVGHRVYYAEAP